MRRTTVTILIGSILVLTLALGQARAEEEPYPTPDVTAGTMVLDVALVRPLGIFSTLFGAAAYIVALPFTLPTGSVDEAGQKLVVDPFKYTFQRPLGLLHHSSAGSY